MKKLLFFVVLVFLLKLVSAKGIMLKLERIGTKSSGESHPKKQCGPFSIFSKALGLCVKKTGTFHKISTNNQLQNNTIMRYYQASLYTPNNLAYQTTISLGTQLKEFKVAVDTGGSNLWVPGSNCQLYEKGNRIQHSDCNVLSKVYLPSSGIHVQQGLDISYKKGSVKGVFVEDVFVLGDTSSTARLPNKVKIGVAQEIRDTGVVGNLGLSLGALKQQSHVFRQLKDHYLHQNPDKTFSPSFTIWLIFASNQQDEGVMTVGSHDLNDCKEIESNDWLRVSDIHKREWYAEIDQIEFGLEKQVSVNRKAINTALFDTGDSWIQVTPLWYQTIKEVLNAHQEGDLLVVPCNVKNGGHAIKLKFRGSNRQFEIPSSAFLLPSKDDIEKCYVLIKQTADDSTPWTLGAPWFRSYCTAFNWETEKIGISTML